MFKYPNETNKQASNNHITVNLWLAKLGRADLILFPSLQWHLHLVGLFIRGGWRLIAVTKLLGGNRKSPGLGLKVPWSNQFLWGAWESLSYTVKGRMSRWAQSELVGEPQAQMLGGQGGHVELKPKGSICAFSVGAVLFSTHNSATVDCKWQSPVCCRD